MRCPACKRFQSIGYVTALLAGRAVTGLAKRRRTSANPVGSGGRDANLNSEWDRSYRNIVVRHYEHNGGEH